MKIPSFFRNRKADAPEDPLAHGEEDADRANPDIDTVEHEEVQPDDRAPPSVNRGLRTQARITNVIIFSVIILVTLFALWRYYAHLFEQRRQREEASDVDKTASVTTNLPPLVTPPMPEPPQPTAELADAYAGQQPAGAGTPPPAPPSPLGTATVGADGQPVKPAWLLVRERRMESEVMFDLDGTSTAGSGTMPQPQARQAGSTSTDLSQFAGQDGGGSRDALAESLRPTITADASASFLPDRNFLLAKGAHSPCTIREALDSTLPGMITCVLAEDVWSDNGAVKLMEKATEFTGEAKQGLSHGQRRMGILWTQAKTPHGVVIELNSPGTDALGRSGVDGEIDNHFWDRFGNAIIVSLIDDVGSAVVARQQAKAGQGNTTNINLAGTAQAANDISAEIIKQSANIPPTLRKNQAGTINIYVARNLDFSTVYRLRQVKR